MEEQKRGMEMTGVNPELSRLVVDPAAYAEWSELQDAFGRARRDGPVARIEAEGFDPFWAITKADDIREVERQADIFRQNGLRAGLHSRAGYEEAQKLPPNMSMTALDGLAHSKLRGVSAGWFMAGRVKRLEAQLRPLAKAAVAQMLETGGSCDFSEDVALRYPLRVILSILGVPAEDEDVVLSLTQNVFRSGRSSVGKRGSPTDNSAIAEFRTYFESLTENRRRNPQDDLATVIANAAIDGDPLSHSVATAYYITIATAGHDTTSSSLAGAIWALCRHPDQLAALKARPELISKLPDEAVRWTTPVQHFMRTAAEPYVLRGQQLEAGDWLMLCYPSGNRDEAVFEDPDRFNVERAPNSHVAFGYGPHMCLGMYLAKLELQLFFEELLPHLKQLELHGIPERASSFFVGGPTYVPIRFEVA
jgi:cytochrome P450